MLLFELREPINAWSHAAGMLLALPVTWFLWKRCVTTGDSIELPSPVTRARHQRVKALCLIVFGITLTICYGTSAALSWGESQR